MTRYTASEVINDNDFGREILRPMRDKNSIIIIYGSKQKEWNNISHRDSVESLLKSCTEFFKLTKAEASNVCLTYINEDSNYILMDSNKPLSKYITPKHKTFALLPCKETLTFLVGCIQIKKTIDMRNNPTQVIKIMANKANFDAQSVKMKPFMLDCRNKNNGTIILTTFKLQPSLPLLTIGKLDKKIHGLAFFAENYESHNNDYATNDDILYFTLQWNYLNEEEIFANLTESIAAKLSKLIYMVELDSNPNLQFDPLDYIPKTKGYSFSSKNLQKKFRISTKETETRNVLKTKQKFISIFLNHFRVYQYRFFKAKISTCPQNERIYPGMDILIGITNQKFCLASYKCPNYTDITTLETYKILNNDIELTSLNTISIGSDSMKNMMQNIVLISDSAHSIYECYRAKIWNFIMDSKIQTDNKANEIILTEEYLRYHLKSKSKITRFDQKIMYFDKHGTIKFRKNSNDTVMSIFSKKICKRHISMMTESFVLAQKKLDCDLQTVLKYELSVLDKEKKDITETLQNFQIMNSGESGRDARLKMESTLIHSLFNLMSCASEYYLRILKQQYDAIIDIENSKRTSLALLMLIKSVEYLNTTVSDFSFEIGSDLYLRSYLKLIKCSILCFKDPKFDQLNEFKQFLEKLSEFLEIFGAFRTISPRIFTGRHKFMGTIFDVLERECTALNLKPEEVYETPDNINTEAEMVLIKKAMEYIKPIIEIKSLAKHAFRNRSVSELLSYLINRLTAILEQNQELNLCLLSYKNIKVVLKYLLMMPKYLENSNIGFASKILTKSFKNIDIDELISHKQRKDFENTLIQLEFSLKQDYNMFDLVYWSEEEINDLLDIFHELKSYHNYDEKSEGENEYSRSDDKIKNYLDNALPPLHRMDEKQLNHELKQFRCDDILMKHKLDLNTAANDNQLFSTKLKKNNRNIINSDEVNHQEESINSSISNRKQPGKLSENRIKKNTMITKINKINFTSIPKLNQSTKNELTSKVKYLEELAIKKALKRDKMMMINTFFDRCDKISSYVKLACEVDKLDPNSNDERENLNPRVFSLIFALFHRFFFKIKSIRFQFYSLMSLLHTNMIIFEYAIEDYEKDVDVHCTSFLYYLFEQFTSFFSNSIDIIKTREDNALFAAIEIELRALNFDFYNIFSVEELRVDDDSIICRNLIIISNVFELLKNRRNEKTSLCANWAEFCQGLSSKIREINIEVFNLNASHESQKHFLNNFFKIFDLVDFVTSFIQQARDYGKESTLGSILSMIGEILLRIIDIQSNIFDKDIETNYHIKTEVNVIMQEIAKSLHIISQDDLNKITDSINNLTLNNKTPSDSDKVLIKLLDMFGKLSASLYDIYKALTISAYSLYMNTVGQFSQVVAIIRFCISNFPRTDELDFLYESVKKSIIKTIDIIDDIFAVDLINNEQTWYQVFAKIYKDTRSIINIIVSNHPNKTKNAEKKSKQIIENKSYCLINHLGEFLSKFEVDKSDDVEYFLIQSINVFESKEIITNYVNSAIQSANLKKKLRSGEFRHGIFKFFKEFLRNYNCFAHSLSKIKEINYISELNDPEYLENLLESIDHNIGSSFVMNPVDKSKFLNMIEKIDKFLQKENDKISSIMDLKYVPELFTPSINSFLHNKTRKFNYLISRSSQLSHQNAAVVVSHYYRILDMYKSLFSYFTKYPMVPNIYNKLQMVILLDNYQYMSKRFAKKKINPSITMMVNNIIVICEDDESSQYATENLISIFQNSLDNVEKVMASSNIILRSCEVICTNIMHYRIELETSVEFFQASFTEMNATIRDSYYESYHFITDVIFCTLEVYYRLSGSLSRNSKLDIDPEVFSNYFIRIDWLMKLYFETVQSFFISLSQADKQSILDLLEESINKLSAFCNSLKELFYIRPSLEDAKNLLMNMKAYFVSLKVVKKMMVKSSHKHDMNHLLMQDRMINMISEFKNVSSEPFGNEMILKNLKDIKNSLQKFKPEQVTSIMSVITSIKSNIIKLYEVIFETILLIENNDDAFLEHVPYITNSMENILLNSKLASSQNNIKSIRDIFETFIYNMANDLLNMYMLKDQNCYKNLVHYYFCLHRSKNLLLELIDSYILNNVEDQFIIMKESLKATFLELTLNSKVLVVLTDEFKNKSIEKAESNTKKFIEKFSKIVDKMIEDCQKNIPIEISSCMELLRVAKLLIIGISFFVGKKIQNLTTKQRAYVFRNFKFEYIILIIAKIAALHLNEAKFLKIDNKIQRNITILEGFKRFFDGVKKKVLDFIEKDQKSDCALANENCVTRSFETETLALKGLDVLLEFKHIIYDFEFISLALKYCLERAKSIIYNKRNFDKPSWVLSVNILCENIVDCFLKIVLWCTHRSTMTNHKSIIYIAFNDSFECLKTILSAIYDKTENRKSFTEKINNFYAILEENLLPFNITVIYHDKFEVILEDYLMRLDSKFTKATDDIKEARNQAWAYINFLDSNNTNVASDFKIVLDSLNYIEILISNSIKFISSYIKNKDKSGSSINTTAMILICNVNMNLLNYMRLVYGFIAEGCKMTSDFILTIKVFFSDIRYFLLEYLKINESISTQGEEIVDFNTQITSMVQYLTKLLQLENLKSLPILSDDLAKNFIPERMSRSNFASTRSTFKRKQI